MSVGKGYGADRQGWRGRRGGVFEYTRWGHASGSARLLRGCSRAWLPRTCSARADAVLEGGDLEGYGVWKGILKAVEELMRVEPVDYELIN